MWMSLQDVLAGLVYVFCLMPLYIMVVEDIDNFLLTHEFGPLVAVVIPLLICIYYPSLDKWNTARGDTTMVVSVSTGVLVGYWIMHQCGMISHQVAQATYPLPALTVDLITMSIMRLLVGAVVLLVARTLLKFILYGTLCRMFNVDKNDPKMKQMLKVELPYKFITYSVIAVLCVMCVPLIFKWLGIQRDSYFTEGCSQKAISLTEHT